MAPAFGGDMSVSVTPIAQSVGIQQQMAFRKYNTTPSPKNNPLHGRLAMFS